MRRRHFNVSPKLRQIEMTQIPPVKVSDSDDVTNMHGRSAQSEAEV